MRTTKNERQLEREEIEEEKKARREATGNQGRERRVQVVVAVKISRIRLRSMRPATSDGQERDVRITDSGREETIATGLKTSQHATTARLNNTPSPPINLYIITELELLEHNMLGGFRGGKES